MPLWHPQLSMWVITYMRFFGVLLGLGSTAREVCSQRSHIASLIVAVLYCYHSKQMERCSPDDKRQTSNGSEEVKMCTLTQNHMNKTSSLEATILSSSVIGWESKRRQQKHEMPLQLHWANLLYPVTNPRRGCFCFLKVSTRPHLGLQDVSE